MCYASERLKNDKEVVLKAAIRGAGIKYASDELKKDPDIIELHKKLVYDI